MHGPARRGAAPGEGRARAHALRPSALPQACWSGRGRGWVQRGAGRAARAPCGAPPPTMPTTCAGAAIAIFRVCEAADFGDSARNGTPRSDPSACLAVECVRASKTEKARKAAHAIRDAMPMRCDAPLAAARSAGARAACRCHTPSRPRPLPGVPVLARGGWQLWRWSRPPPKPRAAARAHGAPEPWAGTRGARVLTRACMARATAQQCVRSLRLLGSRRCTSSRRAPRRQWRSRSWGARSLRR